MGYFLPSPAVVLHGGAARLKGGGFPLAEGPAVQRPRRARPKPRAPAKASAEPPPRTRWPSTANSTANPSAARRGAGGACPRPGTRTPAGTAPATRPALRPGAAPCRAAPHRRQLGRAWRERGKNGPRLPAAAWRGATGSPPPPAGPEAAARPQGRTGPTTVVRGTGASSARAAGAQGGIGRGARLGHGGDGWRQERATPPRTAPVARSSGTRGQHEDSHPRPRTAELLRSPGAGSWWARPGLRQRGAGLVPWGDGAGAPQEYNAAGLSCWARAAQGSCWSREDAGPGETGSRRGSLPSFPSCPAWEGNLPTLP